MPYILFRITQYRETNKIGTYATLEKAERRALDEFFDNIQSIYMDRINPDWLEEPDMIERYNLGKIPNFKYRLENCNYEQFRDEFYDDIMNEYKSFLILFWNELEPSDDCYGIVAC